MLTTATHVTPVETIKIDPRYLAIKRVLDISLVLLALLPLCLVMILIALCIRLDSDGPALFRQKRLGQDGVEFVMLKFRSMYAGSDDGPHRETIAHYML